jgi:TonB family protein
MNNLSFLSNEFWKVIFMVGALLPYSEFAFSQSSITGPPHLVVRPKPRADGCEKPQWPTRALAKGQEGVVQIAVLVGLDGNPIHPFIQHSTGFPMLDTAAKTALMKCSWQPGTIDDKPIPMLMTMTYYWFSVPSGYLGETWRELLHSAKEGDASALYSIAKMQAADSEMQSAGIRLLMSLAEVGHPLAQYDIAARYEEGDGMKKNIEQAEVWYAKAALQGEMLAVERSRLIKERNTQ